MLLRARDEVPGAKARSVACLNVRAEARTYLRGKSKNGRLLRKREAGSSLRSE